MPLKQIISRKTSLSILLGVAALAAIVLFSGAGHSRAKPQAAANAATDDAPDQASTLIGARLCGLQMSVALAKKDGYTALAHGRDVEMAVAIEIRHRETARRGSHRVSLGR